MVRKLVYAVAAFAVIGGGIYALGTTTVRDVLDAKLRADCAGQDRAGNCVKRMLAMGHVRSRAGEMDSAKYWYAAAAEQGDTAAMFHLAWVHDQADLKDVKAQEIGWVPRFGAVAPATPEFFIEQIAKDRAESAGGVGKRHIDLAKRWYQAAANRGFAPAMNNLGAIYASGRGNRPEKSRAFVMFKSAAKLGNPVGQWNLSVAYTAGIGVTLNAAQAEKWAAWTPPATAMADLDEPTLARTRLLPTTLSASQREAVRTSARTGESVTMSHVLLRRKSSRCYWIASLCR